MYRYADQKERNLNDLKTNYNAVHRPFKPKVQGLKGLRATQNTREYKATTTGKKKEKKEDIFG